MVDEVEVKDGPVDVTAARDEVNDDVRAAISSLKGEVDSATPAEVPAVDGGGDDQPVDPAGTSAAKPSHQSDPNRNADGTFKSKTDAAPAQAAAPEQKPATTESVAKPSVEQPSTAAGAAPVSWSPDAKALWQSLPPAIQNAVLKREDEASKGFRQYSEQNRRYEQALAPVAQEAAKRGMSIDDGIRRLMDGHLFIEQQPAQAILSIAQRAGIDLAELAQNPPAAQPQARPVQAPQSHPEYTALEQRLSQIELGQNLSIEQQFRADSNHPYYADVEEQLPAIINELHATHPHISPLEKLTMAYDRAVWLNPDVRAKVIAAQQAEQQQTQQAKVAEKAAQATRAAVSIRGSSASSAPPPKPQSNGTVYDDVRAAVNQLRAG